MLSVVAAGATTVLAGLGLFALNVPMNAKAPSAAAAAAATSSAAARA